MFDKYVLLLKSKRWRGALTLFKETETVHSFTIACWSRLGVENGTEAPPEQALLWAGARGPSRWANARRPGYLATPPHPRRQAQGALETGQWESRELGNKGLVASDILSARGGC